jgi:predicted CXXCH cytochrome family protein
VKLKVSLAGLTILLNGTLLLGQFTGDVLGMHNLGPGTKSPVAGALPEACAYCHAPHSGLNMGLWNQRLTTQTYTTYTSDTETNRGKQPTIGYSSNQCLSCHDGTVAVGSTVAYGRVSTSGTMYSPDVFGSNMQPSHPYSLVTPLKDNIDLAASLVATHKTADPTGAVRLIAGNVECISCHNPHVQAKDIASQNFLVKDSSSGQMCLACHDPTRTVSGKVNPLADWATSVHALSSDKISPSAGLGSYSTVALDGCISCHVPHNASGTSRLLRGQNEQDCLTCHNGGSSVSGMAAYANLANEYSAPKVGHPFPSSNNPHDAAESALLNNNRHATCVDCHNAHGSQSGGLLPPAPLIRISQRNIAGISSMDGVTVLAPAINQYENCLRCHGTSSGKQVLPIYGYLPVRTVSAGDPLNLIPQFASTATSSHPVTHTSNSGLGQPSLLANMWNQDGVTHGRSMGTQVFCTDCHNSDDNREFGGSGPNGPHGSKWTHILERRYEFSQAATPGALVSNLFPNPDLSVTGPYALCGKCHNLSIVQSSTSWIGHTNHMIDGFTCSTCHTAHGMGANSGNISGERLVNFDVNVVAPNGNLPISYNRGSNTCALVCHQIAHNPDGTVTQASLRRGIGVKR